MKKEFETKLNRWYYDILYEKTQHELTASCLAARSQSIRIPLLILSTVMGTAAFTTLINESRISTILVGTMGILLAVLNALQTNLKLAERAKAHKTVAEGLKTLQARLERIETRQDEKGLDQFLEVYPSQKKALFDGVKDNLITISSRIKEKAKTETQVELDRIEANRRHQEEWDPYRERDRCYNDVAHILLEIQDEDQGEEDCAFRMRKRLNHIHLGRPPEYAVEEIKAMLHKLGIYQRTAEEAESFSDRIDPAFIKSVMLFQSRQDLDQVDGIIGPYTKTRLSEEVSEIVK
jgi:murein L,D-transpeptidase YcbB/YkuD